MAAFDPDADPAVVAAHQRLQDRALTVRADWRRVVSIGRNALTRPAIVGGVALLGVVVGRRSRPPVEYKTTGGAPPFLRMLLVAVVTPVLKHAVSNALNQAVAAAPHEPVMTKSAAMATPDSASSP